MDPDRTLEALERDFSEVLKSKALPDAELTNHVRYEALFRLRVGTEARGELNRRPEEIHMVLDGLSRRGADLKMLRIMFYTPERKRELFFVLNSSLKSKNRSALDQLKGGEKLGKDYFGVFFLIDVWHKRKIQLLVVITARKRT